MGPRAGLDWCGKSRPTGIRSPDRPALRQSLYRLRYPALCLYFCHSLYHLRGLDHVCPFSPHLVFNVVIFYLYLKVIVYSASGIEVVIYSCISFFQFF